MDFACQQSLWSTITVLYCGTETLCKGPAKYYSDIILALCVGFSIKNPFKNALKCATLEDKATKHQIWKLLKHDPIFF